MIITKFAANIYWKCIKWGNFI